jgi:hypothetical protein
MMDKDKVFDETGMYRVTIHFPNETTALDAIGQLKKQPFSTLDQPVETEGEWICHASVKLNSTNLTLKRVKGYLETFLPLYEANFIEDENK